MGVSGIGQSGDLSAKRQEMVQKLFKKLDTDGNGSISKDEMKAAADQQKAKAGKEAPANAPSIDDIFKSADTDGDNGISQDELLAQMSMAGPPGGGGKGMQGAQGGRPSGGSPSGSGGGSPAGGAPEKTESSTSSSTKISTDPADADGDGKVSAAERRAYQYKEAMKALIGAIKDAAGATAVVAPEAQPSETVSVVA